MTCLLRSVNSLSDPALTLCLTQTQKTDGAEGCLWSVDSKTRWKPRDFSISGKLHSSFFLYSLVSLMGLCSKERGWFLSINLQKFWWFKEHLNLYAFHECNPKCEVIIKIELKSIKAKCPYHNGRLIYRHTKSIDIPYAHLYHIGGVGGCLKCTCIVELTF